MEFSILILFLFSTIAVVPPAQSHVNSTTPDQLVSWKSEILKFIEINPNATAEEGISKEQYMRDAIGNSFAKTVVRTLYDLRPNISELWKNKIELSDEYYTNFAPHLTLEEEGYMITFGDILFRKSYEQSELSASTQINCVFSDLLQVTIPIEGNDIEFSGSVNIRKVTENTSISTDFSITLTNLRISATTRKNHTAHQKLQNNQSKFEILYDNSNIDVNAQPGYESITTKALSTLIPVIRSHIKAKITPQFAIILTQNISFAELSAYCMQPLKLISKPDPSKGHLYFHVHSEKVNLPDYSLTLSLAAIRIDGMLNIKSIRLTPNNENITFSTLIENLNGTLNMTYCQHHCEAKAEYSELNFSTGSINVIGTLLSSGVISNVQTQFQPFAIPSTSDNPIALFGSQILIHELKKFIASQVNSALQAGVFAEQFFIAYRSYNVSNIETKEVDKHHKRTSEYIDKTRLLTIILHNAYCRMFSD